MVATKPLNRIHLLDVLRGAAIVGTLGTNIWLFASTRDTLELMFAPREWWASAEDLLVSTSLFLTNGKFLSLLAILFGVGIEIQYRSARRRGRPWLRPYGWRTTLLFLEGFLHFALVFEYDILMGYALAAWVVSFLVMRSTRTIIVAILTAGLIHALLFSLIAPGISAEIERLPPAPPAMELYAGGTYLQQVAHRLDNLLFYRIEALGTLFLNITLFSLGVLLMRGGVFADTPRGAQLRLRLFYLGLCLGVPLNLTLFAQDAGLVFLGRYLFAPVMALFYLGLFSLLVAHASSSTASRGLASIGRCALSCYVLQNVLASILFYGWGFGLIDRLGAAWIVLMWLLICALLAMFAKAWLAHFERGPLEILWRYLSHLPFKRYGRASLRQ